MSGRRPLAPEEHDLWRRATRNVAPLRPETTPRRHDLAGEAGQNEPQKPPTQKQRRCGNLLAPHAVPITPHRHAAPRDLFSAGDPGADRRLKRGRSEIDATLDLHGMTQISAHRALRNFIERARAQGHRRLLVITGKGGREGRGVLRQRLRDWIEEPELRVYIARASEAHQRHGGAGAVYLFVKDSRAHLGKA